MTESPAFTEDAQAQLELEDPEAQPAAPAKPTVDLLGRTWTIERKPPTLLLAELARAMSSGKVEQMGAFVDLFEVVLGKEQYAEFRLMLFDADLPEEAFMDLTETLMNGALGRPTK